MTSMTAMGMSYRPGELRKTVTAGETVELTFRGHPYATVVPTELWERAQAALAREQACEQQKQEVV